MFVFDTDHLGILQRKTEPELSNIRARLNRHSSGEFFVSIISFHEQVAGWSAHLARAKTPKDIVFAYKMFGDVLADFAILQILDYDERASAAFLALKKRRIRIGTMDLRIAAVALANDMTLLTRNTVDFERVPDLRFEDWTVS